MLAGGDPSLEPLRLSLDDRRRCFEIVRGDREHFVLQPLDLASTTHIAEDNYAPIEVPVGIVQWTGAKTQRTAPDPEPQRILKAIDIFTGEIAWTLPQPGPANSWGGTLTTASGLVIFGEEGGALMVADASKGNPLWSFETNQTWRASPMTYMFDGRQFVAVAAGPNIIAFAIHE